MEYKVATPCVGDHQCREEEIGSVGELSTVCSQIVLYCQNLDRIGRPDILWSVNKLARAVTKWTKAWDKRLARLISYIHHTCEYRQYCYVWNTAQQCRLGLFQDSDLAGDLEDSKSWIFEEALGKDSAKRSRRSYCRNKDEFIESLQSCAHIYSYASSDENSRCKGSSGESMGKARENTSLAVGASEEQKGGYSGHSKKSKKIHVATLMDICHLKNSELEPQFQKYKGRVVLRGDIVKDDSGSYAVFTEQGSSASQMTAAKVMDVMARLTVQDKQLTQCQLTPK